MSKSSSILIIEPTKDYELLDSGNGEKLERFGDIVLSRPDPQALWAKNLPANEWKKADAHFTREGSGGRWVFRKDVPSKWQVSFGGKKFWIKPTAFKHTGLFPEQEPNWRWMEEKIKEQNSSRTPIREAKSKDLDLEILNLFGYTGGATLACASAGAKVVHIDGSKTAVAWARDNAEASGLTDAPIRWIVEDARVFVGREIKRGRKYHGIVMDPPAFGHGPSSELWKIEEHLLPLFDDCVKLLSNAPLFFIINGYSAGYSAVAYENLLLKIKERFGGSLEIGELAVEERKARTEKGDKTNVTTGRLLPAGIFARWSSVG